MDDPEPGYGGRDTRVDDPCKDGSASSSDFQPDGCADDVIASYKLRRKYRRTERAKSEMEVRTEEEGEEKRRGEKKKEERGRWLLMTTMSRPGRSCWPYTCRRVLISLAKTGPS